MQVLQLEMNRAIKKGFEVKLEDVFHEDPYTNGNYHDENTLKKKVLKGISAEEVYKLEFNCIDKT